MPAKKPGFGEPLNPPSYYAEVSSIITVLRDYSTLKTIAGHLHAQGFLSPAGKEFTKQHVANFLRSPHYISTK
jgi:hypothetical protein